MEKKKYVKPSMEVYVLNQPTKLLVGSDPNAPGYPGGFGYAPGDDEKKLA
ncbi:MAG: hypothetical protein J6W38_04665 [Prevotella sp.]|jgi:hypothetical protein|nr:hypothetical protein [Prevotella sp.]